MSRRAGVVLARAERLEELESRFGGSVDAAARALRVDRIVAPELASAQGELVPLTNGRYAPAALAAPGAVLVTPALAARVPEGRRWVHEHASWVVARLLAEALGSAAWHGTAHCPERAHVFPGALLHESVVVGAGAVVREGVVAGEGCVIGEGAVLLPGVVLGARVIVGPNAVLGRPGFGHAVGPGGELARVPQLGGVIVEDDVELGALVTVDAGTLGPTRIGRGTRLDAHVHVGHNVELGEGVLVAAQSGFAGSARVGARVRVGGQAGVGDHVRVGEGAAIAARSGAVGDVRAGEVVAGFPAVERTRFLRALATMLRRRPDSP